ncbi:LamG-like jellyroll fold domain-containing protein [Streptomyces microflavus]|uniref:LamG-like jellyroll fold domain-containing protein n=1 Tax=Streptomyces microflavus TaxID=1919 RepID=UPI0034432E23
MTAALLATISVPAPPAVAAAPETESVELSEGEKALAEAKESGQRVEVLSQRSERTTVLANPDGFTFTLRESSVPVRVPKSGGGWQAPDATLEKRADGSVAPKAAAPQIVFSGGREQAALASIASKGRSLELTWPGKLPAPTLDGPSAVYANVLPDVDLRVTATVEGFKHVLVVKTPEAAAREELKKLTFGLKTTGLNVEEGSSGNLAAVDADGKTVFKAPTARMWNSAGRDLPQPPAVAGARVAADETLPSDPAEAAPSGSGSEPGQGDAVAKMDIAVGKDTLTIVPDAELLAAKDISVFPLFIDPSVTWGESERTLLRSDGYEDYAWGNGEDDLGKGAGKCGTWNGYYCGPGYVQRLYFEFSPASLKGKHILDATFRVTEPWAFQCDPRWVDLIRTPDGISSSTTWASRPQGGWDTMGDRNVSAGRADLCSPGLPDAAIEFNDNPEETNENLTPTVRAFAAGKFSRLTLMIKANNEEDTSAWKRFRNDAVLEVKYVGLPALPAEVGLVAGTGQVCSTNSGVPTVVSDPTPLVTGRPKTASGGSDGANLRIRWRTDKWNGSAWVTAHTDIDGPTTGYVGNLAKQSRSLPTLQEGVQYRLKALTMSYLEGGSNRLNTGYTTPCYFKVDPTAPKAPKITIGAPYAECLPNACAALGGPGQKATFKFAPADGDAGIVSYQYTLSGMSSWPTANGATVSVPLTPERSGTYTLWARAKDTVGRYGAWNAVDFLVATGQGSVGRWHFDEASGIAMDTATAQGVPKHEVTLAGGALRDDRGRRGVIAHDAHGVPLETPLTDRGLVLNGQSAYATTSTAVLEPRSSYTVASWVRLDDLSKSQAILAQDGKANAAFMLSYQIAQGYSGWFFGVKSTDGLYQGEISEEKAPQGVWTHVAGTYDAPTKTLKLYVNGVLKSARTGFEVAIEEAGPLRIGLVQSNGKWYQPFHGSIDEPAVWQRALTPEEIADETRLLISDKYAGTELIADWNPTRGVDGITIKDTTSAYGKTLTLAGGAMVTGEQIVLDGVDDAATAPGPLVDDTGSFTVTTAAALDGAKLVGKDIGYIGQVMGQRTADGSAWGLWFELTEKKTVLDEETMEEVTVPVGLWHFGRLETDGTFSSVTSDEVASVDSAVRLTGVHDSVDGTISLYVGYSQNGDAKAYTAKLGSGDFALGKAFAGGWKHFLPARISDVRLWAGAMASADQIEATVGD